MVKSWVRVINLRQAPSMNTHATFRRHSRESGNPSCSLPFGEKQNWIPAFAGLTARESCTDTNECLWN
jgi:hypothetical protein